GEGSKGPQQDPTGGEKRQSPLGEGEGSGEGRQGLRRGQGVLDTGGFPNMPTRKGSESGDGYGGGPEHVQGALARDLEEAAAAAVIAAEAEAAELRHQVGMLEEELRESQGRVQAAELGLRERERELEEREAARG
ncbi:unnamed protein product, partial [Discosporangium mesarthrocarpum]